MKFRVEVVCLSEEGAEQRCPVIEVERQQLAMETLGLSLEEGKAILSVVQDFVTSQQTIEDLKQRRNCPCCGRRYRSKETGMSTVQTVFGPVAVLNPRRVGSMLLSGRRPEELSAHGDVADRADKSGVTLSGDEVGLSDSFPESGRSIEGSVAGGRVDESRNGA